MAQSSELPQSKLALILIDVINDLDFDGNEELLEGLETLTHQLSKLKRAARRANLPVIYLNDNFNNWHSNFNEQLEMCTSARSKGRELAKALAPTRQDFFVLKPMHSGFFGTPLNILLKKLGVEHLILAGIAADICVLYTANDAYMRDYKLTIVSDGVISNQQSETDLALKKMEWLLKARILNTQKLVNELNKGK